MEPSQNERNNKISRDQDPSFLVSTLRGLRNGIYYGAKVRFMHSLVMTLLFRHGSLKSKVRSILTMTYQHAKNLGCFAFLYKATVYILKKMEGQPKKYHSFIAGCVAGYIVFREKNNLNYQIYLYVFSRNIVGAVENLVKKGKLPNVKAFPILAMLSWGIVMYLYMNDPTSLQPSLKSSMDFLYKHSETYKDWTDFVPVAVPKFVKEFVTNQTKRAAGTNFYIS